MGGLTDKREYHFHGTHVVAMWTKRFCLDAYFACIDAHAAEVIAFPTVSPGCMLGHWDT